MTEVKNFTTKTTPVGTDLVAGMQTAKGVGDERLFTLDSLGLGIGNIGFAAFDTDLSDTMLFVGGSYLDEPSVVVTSDGATITLSIEKSGTGDIRVHFLTGIYTWDCTPADTVTLTAGSDTVPTMNYVYIDEATKTLQTNTSGFPIADIVHVAEVLCPSATKVNTEGPYAQRNWTDHLASTTCGHLTHLNRWVRAQAATWVSGVALTPTITVNGGAEDNVNIATSSGSVLQLHPHTYPARDTGVSSHVQVINDFTTPYVEITDLNAADTDDAGNAITNNKWTNLVIWGAVSEDAADCHLLVNLPSAFHGSAQAATIDAERYSNYTIPANYLGTGFLIARLTLKYTTGSSGTWTLEENLDLRSSGVVGGSAAGSTEFSDNVFRILDNADTTKELAFQLSGITTATTRTLTAPDADGTVALTSDLAVTATQTAEGLVELATTAEAQTGTSDTVVPTVAKVQDQIDDNALAVTFNRIIGSDLDDTAHRELTAAEVMTILSGAALNMADALLTRPEIKDYSKTQDVQATATGATTLDMAVANEFFLTLTGNITLTFSNPPATGKVGNFTLKTKQDATGSRTITWPASVDWGAATAPTISTAANAIDFFTFHTDDAGTIYYGFNPGLAMG